MRIDSLVSLPVVPLVVPLVFPVLSVEDVLLDEVLEPLTSGDVEPVPLPLVVLLVVLEDEDDDVDGDVLLVLDDVSLPVVEPVPLPVVVPVVPVEPVVPVVLDVPVVLPVPAVFQFVSVLVPLVVPVELFVVLGVVLDVLLLLVLLDEVSLDVDVLLPLLPVSLLLFRPFLLQAVSPRASTTAQTPTVTFLDKDMLTYLPGPDSDGSSMAGVIRATCPPQDRLDGLRVARRLAPGG